MQPQYHSRLNPFFGGIIERDESDDEVHHLMLQATIEASKRDSEEGRLNNQYTSPNDSSDFEKIFQTARSFQPGSSLLQDGAEDVEEQQRVRTNSFEPINIKMKDLDSKEKEQVESKPAPTSSKPAFPVPLSPVEVGGSIRSISDSASSSLSVKDRPRDFISLLSGRTRLHHPSSTPEISSMAAVPTLEEVNAAFDALRTLLGKPAVEVFNTPADRDQCRQLVITLSSYHASLKSKIILDDFFSRLPEYEKSIPAAVSTRESALAFRDSNLTRVNELSTVLKEGKTSLSSLEDKLDELRQRHDTLTELIRKLEAERDQVQTLIIEAATERQILSEQVSSDYQAWEQVQKQSIKAENDMIHSENTITGVELAWSTLNGRLFRPSN